MNKYDHLKDGEPCGHPGCLHHVTHHCEKCKRIQGRESFILPCPMCGNPFDINGITKHYMGEVYEQYKCPGCGLLTPKLRVGGFLIDWWNRRKNL